MNRFNLTKLSRYGVLAEITSTGAGHPIIRINLPANLSNLGFEGPPFPFESDKFTAATAHIADADRREFFETDDSCLRAARVLEAFARQGRAVADANNDRSLSGDGRLQRAQGAMTASLTVIGTQFTALKNIETELERQYAALYAAPAADVQGTLTDQEVRRWFTSMVFHDQIAILNNPDRDNTRLLVALKRSPIPLEQKLADIVRDAWVNQVAIAQPEKAATLKIAMDNCGWALRLTRFIAYYAANANLSGTRGSIDRFRTYVILKPTGGAAVLEFTDQEIAMYERRLQQAAA